MAMLMLVGTMAGCSTTQRESVQRVGPSGFLGDTSMLTPGDKEQTSLRYVNPAAQWAQYKKVLLEPVTFWGDDRTKISAADQQMLCNFLHEQLYDQLRTKYELVTEPGPGVMRLQVAIVDAESATPVLRTISMAFPRRGC